MAFADGLTDTTAVEYDAAAAGGLADDEGNVGPVWVAAAGLEAVRCRVCEGKSLRSRNVDVTEDVTWTTLMFEASVPLPRDAPLRFRVVDPASGEVVYYYGQGKPSGPRNAPYRSIKCLFAAIES